MLRNLMIKRLCWWMTINLLFLSYLSLEGSRGESGCIGNLPPNTACVPLLFTGSTSPPLCEAAACDRQATTWFPGCVYSDQSITNPVINPVPPFNELMSIQVTVAGRFQCSSETTYVVMTLNDCLIGEGQPSSPIPGCSCPNCAQQASFTANNCSLSAENNTLTITPLGGFIALSEVLMYFTFAAVVPPVSFIQPTSLTIQSQSQKVELWSESQGFVAAQYLTCQFSFNNTFIYTPGIFVDPVVVFCQAPTIPVPGLAFLALSYNNASFSSQFPLYFGDPFQVLSVSPHMIGQNKESTLVTLIGINFVENPLQSIAVKFGTTEVAVISFNQTVIVVQSPPFSAISNGSTTSQSIALQILLSQNGGYSYSDTGFHFKFVINRETLLPLWAWTVAGAAATLLVAAIVYFCLVIRRLRNKALAGYGEGQPLLSGHDRTGAWSSGLDDIPRHLRVSFNKIELEAIQDMQLIEKGSFGLIYKGLWEGSPVAVKKLHTANITPTFMEELEREAEIMKQLRHPNVLNFIGTSCDIQGRQICIVMEYMDRGSLYRLIHDPAVDTITLAQIKAFCLDTARGINYLHHLDPPIIHRDLKSHNLLLNSQGVLKVCDFGLSRFIESTLAGTMTACGTPSWTAPEVLRGERYNASVDVFSFGIVVWELFARQDPYPGVPPFQIVFAVGNQNARPKIDPSWPQHWLKLITDCWSENPFSRPSFDQIMAQLQEFDP